MVITIGDMDRGILEFVRLYRTVNKLENNENIICNCQSLGVHRARCLGSYFYDDIGYV